MDGFERAYRKRIITTAGHLAFFVCAPLLQSCSPEDKAFVTTSTREELQKLSQGTVAIITFSAGQELLTIGGSPGARYKGEAEAELIQTLASEQFKAMRRAIEREYDVVGPSMYQDVASPIEPEQKSTIAEAIKNAGADLGVLVKTHYGWSWGPDKTHVSEFRTLISFAIANQAGDIIWLFSAETDARPAKFDAKALEEIGAGIFAQAPSVKSIVSHHEKVFENYPKVLLALVREDSQGQAHKCDTWDYLYDVREDLHGQTYKPKLGYVTINDVYEEIGFFVYDAKDSQYLARITDEWWR